MATLALLAELVQGRLVGDPELDIVRVAPIDQAGAGDITFLANPKYLARLKDCRASAVIAAPGVDVPIPDQIITANPYLAFARILTHFHSRPAAARGVLPGSRVAESACIDPTATIHPGCVIGEGVSIGAGTVLHPGVCLYEDVVIGADCCLHAQSVVRERCRLGDRVILQPHAVIGSDGFGFAPDGHRYYKIPQVGIVVLEDDVEIGAGSCVDRATLGETRIRRGSKLDNLVQIGHNVVVGEDCILVAQSGFAGSSTIGNHCVFGGQAAVAGHLRVGDNVTVGARGGATGDVAPNQVLSGVPLMPHKEWLRATMTFPKLPEMRKEILQLKKRLEELESVVKENGRA